jgi:methylase of polypeptide subunit release factors
VAHHEINLPIQIAIEVGVGSGVLSAVLAKRGIQQIIATDNEPRAIECAKNNIVSLGYHDQVTLLEQSLFPEGIKADLIVCNPPWVPAKPSSPIENAVFDEDSKFLKAFLDQSPSHLNPNGRIWLILSDLAEHLGLRSREDLLEWFKVGQLEVVSKQDTKPYHPKTRNNDDPLFFARSKEITSLWELKKVRS